MQPTASNNSIQQVTFLTNVEKKDAPEQEYLLYLKVTYQLDYPLNDMLFSKPRGTHYYSSEFLESIGLIGLYVVEKEKPDLDIPNNSL